METLGFHRPQFSEDLAWLPGWVQHHVDQFDHCEDGYLGSSKLTPKVPMLSQGNIFMGNDVIMSLKEDSGHNSHRLFLYGEDNSASSFTSSSRNVLQFSLRLSSNGVSQCTPSSLGASEASRTFSEPDQVLPIRNFETYVTGEENTLHEVDVDPSGGNIIPQNFSPKHCRNDPANTEKSTRHSRGKFSHRHLKDAKIKDAVELSISASEALVIHEIVTSSPDSEELVPTDALEVSLQMKKARSQWVEGDFDLSMGIDETDSLSDLNDFSMTEAFEDVGLVCSSDERDLSDSSMSHVKETPIDEVPCHDILTQKKSETILNSDGKLRMDFPIESLNEESIKKLDNSKIIMQQVKKTNPKMIWQAFARETSFLSESADVAQDVDSVVQIHGMYSLAESQSSVGGVEVLPDKSSDGVLFSQDVVKSPSLYLFDPLCSVVPCSLSIEETSTSEAQKHDHLVTDLGSNTRLEIDCREEQVRHVVNNGLEGSNKEKKPTLKTYSTVFPSSVATSEKGILCCNQSIQSQYGQFVHNHCDEASRELRSTSICLPGIENEVLDLDEELNKKNESYDVVVRNGSDMAVPSPKEGTKPCLLNFGVRHRLRASKPSRVSFFGLGHPEQTSGIDDVISLQQSEKPQSLRSIFKNPHHRSFGAKKRVRFSEPECRIQQNKNVLELKSSGRMCSTKVTSKKLKHSDKSSDNQTCEESFNRCCSNANRRHILQGMQFLLSGLSRKSGKDIIRIIQKYGGIILPDIPSPLSSMGSRNMRSNCFQLPIILSTRKNSHNELGNVRKIFMRFCFRVLLPTIITNAFLLFPQQRTTKFLYGCAVNTFVLHVDWLTDSVKAGSILPYDRYLILPWQAEHSSNITNRVHVYNGNGIFEKVGVMVYGKNSFCTKLEKTVKHGGGQVLKTVRRLVQRLDKEKISVGVIVTEGDNMASRHLRQCAIEWNIPVMSSSWIIQSLHSGKLLPFTE